MGYLSASLRSFQECSLHGWHPVTASARRLLRVRVVREENSLAMSGQLRRMDVEAAREDLNNRTLARIGLEFGRLIYLASTRDYNTGRYYHDGLCCSLVSMRGRSTGRTPIRSSRESDCSGLPVLLPHPCGGVVPTLRGYSPLGLRARGGAGARLLLPDASRAGNTPGMTAKRRSDNPSAYPTRRLMATGPRNRITAAIISQSI